VFFFSAHIGIATLFPAKISIAIFVIAITRAKGWTNL
jgi:hypothetical protein